MNLARLLAGYAAPHIQPSTLDIAGPADLPRVYTQMLIYPDWLIWLQRYQPLDHARLLTCLGEVLTEAATNKRLTGAEATGLQSIAGLFASITLPLHGMPYPYRFREMMEWAHHLLARPPYRHTGPGAPRVGAIYPALALYQAARCAMIPETEPRTPPSVVYHAAALSMYYACHPPEVSTASACNIVRLYYPTAPILEDA